MYKKKQMRKVRNSLTGCNNNQITTQGTYKTILGLSARFIRSEGIRAHLIHIHRYRTHKMEQEEQEKHEKAARDKEREREGEREIDINIHTMRARREEQSKNHSVKSVVHKIYRTT